MAEIDRDPRGRFVRNQMVKAQRRGKAGSWFLVIFLGALIIMAAAGWWLGKPS
jgi:hypothetical protein